MTADDMRQYGFTPGEAIETIAAHWKWWRDRVFGKDDATVKWIVGLSGGKDSTVVAGLAAHVFGKENVIGVMLPQGVQKDIADARRIASHIGIETIELNIANAIMAIEKEVIDKAGFCITDVAKVNLPPRIRMAALYYIAQNLGKAVVLNTSNLTEDILGYATLWGDTCGSYAPIHDYTVGEVVAIGHHLGLPGDLVDKVPADGLQEDTDEDRLGLRYSDADMFIRTGKGEKVVIDRIRALYKANAFKRRMIRIEGPVANLPNAASMRWR